MEVASLKSPWEETGRGIPQEQEKEGGAHRKEIKEEPQEQEREQERTTGDTMKEEPPEQEREQERATGETK